MADDINTGDDAGMENSNNATEPKFSPMEVCFLSTGVLFGAVLVMGFIYFVLFYTQISPARMRAREKRHTTYGDGSGIVGVGPRKTQTHFTLFNSRGSGASGSRL